ncbi:porin [Ottowia testudinis]|uniref:porin n=1 Tax=Ottowia testudinis TaxID=2816950 RepID=UPI001FB05018|nr:porin [Ottowia testudinis]
MRPLSPIRFSLPACRPQAALLALTLGAAPGAAWAQSAVQLWGGVDLGVRHVGNDAGSQTRMQSGNNYTSRLAVTGSEDLGGGLKASFWLEGTVNATGGAFGTGASIWDRRSTLSLSGPFGELRLGRDYTPLFRAFAATDVFGYVGAAGMGTLYNATASTPVARAFGSGATTVARANGAVQYYTPRSLGGFYLNAMLAHASGGPEAADFHFRGVRAGYAAGPLDVSAHAGSTRIEATGKHFKVYGLAGVYTGGQAKLTLGAVRMDYLNARQTNYTLGVDWRVGAGQVRAAYHYVDQSGFAADGSSTRGNDAHVLGLGYVHNLSKRTALYGTAAFVHNQGKARFAVPGGLAGAAAGTGSRGFEVGVRHMF